MANNPLNLLCLVNDKPRSDAFEVEIESTRSVSALKDLIKTEKAKDLRDVDAEKLTLWRASISSENPASTTMIDALDDKIELNNPSTHLSTFFPESPDDNTYIIVQQPPHVPEDISTLCSGHAWSGSRPRPASKRDFDGDAGELFAFYLVHSRAYDFCYQTTSLAFMNSRKKPNEAAVVHVYIDMSGLYISHDTQVEAAILDALSRSWSYQVFHQELSWEDLTVMLRELRPSPRHYFLVDDFQSVFRSSIFPRVAKKFFRNLSSMNAVSCVIVGTFKRTDLLLDDGPMESLFNKANFARMPPFDPREMSRLFDLYKEHCYSDISRQIQVKIAHESGGHPTSFMALPKLTLWHHPDESSYASMLQKNIRPLLEETQTKLKMNLKSMNTEQNARVRDLTNNQMNDWEFIPDDFDRYLLNVGILDSHNDRTVRFTSVIILHICIDVLRPQPENRLSREEIGDPINLLKLGLQCISPSTVAHPLVQNKFGSQETRAKGKDQIDLMLTENNRNWFGCELKVNVISQSDFKDYLEQASKRADSYGIPVYLVNFYQEGRSTPARLFHIPANVAMVNVMRNKGCTRFIITEPDGNQTTVNTNASI
ncbi:hypothetical protein BGZ79_004088 [Entomortierella chlamydospora]|nr:hypothetical protein BGZ79_004088 [Entomortierella chlamydospora]